MNVSKQLEEILILPAASQEALLRLPYSPPPPVYAHLLLDSAENPLAALPYSQSPLRSLLGWNHLKRQNKRQVERESLAPTPDWLNRCSDARRFPSLERGGAQRSHKRRGPRLLHFPFSLFFRSRAKPRFCCTKRKLLHCLPRGSAGRAGVSRCVKSDLRASCGRCTCSFSASANGKLHLPFLFPSDKKKSSDWIAAITFYSPET
uniref:uncharacterized protein LOC114606553 n=1 Tax=Podarcis muralis TaxID=64176 RepID=UPI00109F3434|nr:uncharacterized protein LOC114606553 [Podarcis muralis]